MKKTILLLGILLSSPTHFFAKSKDVLVHPENSNRHLNYDYGKDNQKGPASAARPVVPSFYPIAVINGGTIESQLPKISVNGILGSWSLTSITSDNVYTYTFYPNFGQDATTTTLSFTVFASNTLQAYDRQIGIYCDGLIANIFAGSTINGQYTVTASNAAFSTDFPENAGTPLSINSAGRIVVPYGTPDGSYKIKYKIWLKACNANYSIATQTINVNCHLERKYRPEVLDQNVSISPNPSNGIFTIDLRGINEQYNKVKVFNVTGALMYEGELMPRAMNPIDLSGAQTGYYFAQISNNTNSQTLKLIKE